jgi:hypothetical protein
MHQAIKRMPPTTINVIESGEESALVFMIPQTTPPIDAKRINMSTKNINGPDITSLFFSFIFLAPFD